MSSLLPMRVLACPPSAGRQNRTNMSPGKRPKVTLCRGKDNGSGANVPGTFISATPLKSQIPTTCDKLQIHVAHTVHTTPTKLFQIRKKLSNPSLVRQIFFSVLAYLHFLRIFKLLAAMGLTLDHVTVFPYLPATRDSLHRRAARETSFAGSSLAKTERRGPD